METYKSGSKIHIKKKNRGKFTDYCGGKVTEECILRGKHSSNPTTRKRATFAANARTWKHQFGGIFYKSIDTSQEEDLYNDSDLQRTDNILSGFYNGDRIKDDIPTISDYTSNREKWNDIRVIGATPIESTQTESSQYYTPTEGAPVTKSGYKHTPVKGDISLELKELILLFNKHGINVRVTSGFRHNSKTANGAVSWHANGWAIDVVPADGDFKKLELLVASNPEIVQYLRKHDLGILRETNQSTLRKTRGSGHHWHIGPDNSALRDFNRMLSQYNIT